MIKVYQKDGEPTGIMVGATLYSPLHTLEMHIETLSQTVRKLETDNRTLRLENEKLRAVMLDLVVFGSATIDNDEDAENQENAAAVLEASIKQARFLLGLSTPRAGGEGRHE